MLETKSGGLVQGLGRKLREGEGRTGECGERLERVGAAYVSYVVAQLSSIEGTLGIISTAMHNLVMCGRNDSVGTRAGYAGGDTRRRVAAQPLHFEVESLK